jgi:hypothetical protein
MGMGEHRGTRLMSTFGAGAAAANDITITGIAVGDEIIMAVHMIATDAIITDNLLAEISITAADTVQCATTDTSGGVVWIFWFKKN